MSPAGIRSLESDGESSASSMYEMGAIRAIQEQRGGAYQETCSQEHKEKVLSVLKHIVLRDKQPANSTL